jgi:hypothetical protein
VLKLNTCSLKYNKDNIIPETYINNRKDKMIIKYYDIKLNVVNDNDVSVKKDL